jgi:hypothetical protein
MRIKADGLDKVVEQMRERAERLRDYRPCLEVWGNALVKRIDDCYQNERNWDGSKFAPLAPSTVRARIGKIPGNKRSKKTGRLSKKSKTSRKQMRQDYASGAAGIIKILSDTAVMRNSNHVGKPELHSIDWSSIGRLAYHMAGTSRMPARNPTPFVYENKQWKLRDDEFQKLNVLVQRYVVEGEDALK